jgi:hypothetical protein
VNNNNNGGAGASGGITNALNNKIQKGVNAIMHLKSTSVHFKMWV